MAKTNRNGVYQSTVEQMRRQLGAANAREHRLKQRIQDLERENARLTELGAKYRSLSEEASRLCRDWCLLCTFAATGRNPEMVMKGIYSYTDRMDALGMLDGDGR